MISVEQRIAAAILILVMLGGAGLRTVRAEEIVEREWLIEDLRQLADTIESVHPDPYINMGGKIAFHRCLQQLLSALPDEGMSRGAFYRHVRPLVAGVGDSHTWIDVPYHPDYSRPGGIPALFGIVERTAYVFAVFSKVHKPLIGARLLDVEGVSFEEIVRRQARVQPADNIYHVLRNLGGRGVLASRCYLEHLLPEWSERSRLRVRFLLPNGEVQEQVFTGRERFSGPIDAGSSIILPSRRRCDFAYKFLDPAKRTALLVIDGMTSYRESYEMFRADGYPINSKRLSEVYRRFHGKVPENPSVDQLIEGIPSATEIFRGLLEEMKAAGTERLLIDLRENGGGNSAMCGILIYLLYGREQLEEIWSCRSEVRKLSRLYFRKYRDRKLEELAAGKPFPLTETDYDFDGGRLGVQAFERYISRMPTFENLVRSGRYEGFFQPEHVVALSYVNTFSSGYTLLYYLYRSGALVVGTPSAQAGNCFGDKLGFQLDNTRLTFSVSHKRFDLFPAGAEQGKVLMPHHPLTYEKLAAHDFDLNAEILHALEVLDGRSTVRGE